MMNKSQILCLVLSVIVTSNCKVAPTLKIKNKWYSNIELTSYNNTHLSPITDIVFKTPVTASNVLINTNELLESSAVIDEEPQNEEPIEIYDIDFILTYYSDSPEENGGYAGITCTGDKLEDGMCASNVYPLGTIILFEDGLELVVADRGGNHFNDYNRLDVFVPRLEGESMDDYNNRILEYGKIHKMGRIVNEQ